MQSRPTSAESGELPKAKSHDVAEIQSLDVQTLLAGRTEVRLVHRGEEYRLRITRQGKLLLTK